MSKSVLVRYLWHFIHTGVHLGIVIVHLHDQVLLTTSPSYWVGHLLRVDKVLYVGMVLAKNWLNIISMIVYETINQFLSQQCAKFLQNYDAVISVLEERNTLRCRPDINAMQCQPHRMVELTPSVHFHSSVANHTEWLQCACSQLCHPHYHLLFVSLITSFNVIYY